MPIEIQSIDSSTPSDQYLNLRIRSKDYTPKPRSVMFASPYLSPNATRS